MVSVRASACGAVWMAPELVPQLKAGLTQVLGCPPLPRTGNSCRRGASGSFTFCSPTIQLCAAIKIHAVLAPLKVSRRIRGKGEGAAECRRSPPPEASHCSHASRAFTVRHCLPRSTVRIDCPDRRARIDCADQLPGRRARIDCPGSRLPGSTVQIDCPDRLRGSTVPDRDCADRLPGSARGSTARIDARIDCPD